MEEYIGIIKIFAGNFAPRGWAFCNGALLSVAQNSALFAILGTSYGGNGQTTFGLPDLRSRVPVGGGYGPGPGLTTYVLGEATGTESNSILLSNLPAHNHPTTINVSKANASVSAATVGSSLAAPGDYAGGRTFSPVLGYNTVSPDTALNPATAASATVGSNIPVNNIQPVLGISYIICLEGIFPSRN